MEEKVQFKNQLGENLAGTFHLPEVGSKRAVVLGHCFTCSRHTSILRRLAEDLAKAGFIALRFDFSGNGQSEGEFAESNYTKQVAEMHTAADLVAAKGAKWIGLAGHSLGGLIAFLSAAQGEPFRAVCAIGSRISSMRATHFLNATQREILEKTGEVSFTSRGRFLKITEAFFADAGNFDLPNLLASFDRPLMMIHGDRDEIIPVSEARRAQKAGGGRVRLEIIAGADHMFSNEHHRSEASRLAANWFEEQSQNRNPSS